MALRPASLAPCTRSITTFNKAAEHLGPRYTYNKHPFLPDPTNSNINSSYMLMKGGRKKRRATKKMMKRKTHKSKKRVQKKRLHKSKKRLHKSKKRLYKSKKRTKKIHMRGGGHGGPPYGLPQGFVNIGREIEYGIKSLYESAVGGKMPTNPDPTMQPIGKSGHKSYIPGIVDPEAAEKYAQRTVAKL